MKTNYQPWSVTWKHYQNLADNPTATEAEIAIRGFVGVSNKPGEDWFGPYEGEGGTVQEVAAAIKEIGKVDTLHVRISSEGGIVAHGLAIHNLLASHPARVIAHIDGYAYSIASVIAMAADEVRMPAEALMMIHNASSFAVGDYRAMEQEASALKAHNNVIKLAYANKAGNSPDDWQSLMDATTYMSGVEAKERGLVDVVTNDAVALNSAELHPIFRQSAAWNAMPAVYRSRFDKPAGATTTPSDNDMINEQVQALIDASIATITASHTAEVTALRTEISTITTSSAETITALRTELAEVRALADSGVLNRPSGAPPVGGAGGGEPEKPTMTLAAFNDLQPVEKNDFMAKGGKLI